jgi:hypothetical protein
MKAREGQFNEGLTKRARNRACGVPDDAGLAPGHSSKVAWHRTRRTLGDPEAPLPKYAMLAKVRAGAVGGHAAELSADTAAALAARWETVRAGTGHASYAALRQAFADERRAGRCAAPGHAPSGVSGDSPGS